MKNLEKMNFNHFTVLEVGQHIKSVCEGITEHGTTIRDEILTNYLTVLNSKLGQYNQAMAQMAKSDETAKIAAADKERDNAVTAAQRMLTVFELSNDPKEHEAFVSLNSLFNTYKRIQHWNFEEETSGLDNLLRDCTGDKYSTHIKTLKMESCINRIALANDNFKALFKGRMKETADQEVFDLKTMRTEMKTLYQDMIAFVLSMSKATNQEQYNKSLNAINTTRKYYADMMARRDKPAKSATPPTE